MQNGKGKGTLKVMMCGAKTVKELCLKPAGVTERVLQQLGRASFRTSNQWQSYQKEKKKCSGNE